MQVESHEVKEVTRVSALPKIEFTDILTIIMLVIVGGLLLSDRQVPEYLIALIGLGAGTKMFTADVIKSMYSDIK